MMTVALVLLAILHAASADSGAKCPKGTTAVDGFPHKCFWFKYYSKPNIFYNQDKVCRNMKPGKHYGRPFTPESKEEMMKVEQAVIPIPTGKIPEGYGIYFVSYVLYNGPFWGSSWGPKVNLFFYAAYNPPHNIINSTSDMWAEGEPNGGYGCLNAFGSGCETVVEASMLIGFPSGQRGLCDIPEDKNKYSVLCEFPSDN